MQNSPSHPICPSESRKEVNLPSWKRSPQNLRVYFRLESLHLPHIEPLYCIDEGLNSTLLSLVPRNFLKTLTDIMCRKKKKTLDSLFCGFLSVGELRHTIQLSRVSTFSILPRHSSPPAPHLFFSLFLAPHQVPRGKTKHYSRQADR